MDLVSYVKKNGSLEHVPKGMHAIINAQPNIGLHPGVIFALCNTDSNVNVNQQNRLHPYYLVYIDNNGNVLINHIEVKQILDLLRAACKNRAEPMKSLYQAFNQETKDGRKMDAYSCLLEQGIHSIIEVKEQKDIESLFSSGGTSALINTISGLDNFELIALVVREGGGPLTVDR